MGRSSLEPDDRYQDILAKPAKLAASGNFVSLSRFRELRENSWSKVDHINQLNLTMVDICKPCFWCKDEIEYLRKRSPFSPDDIELYALRQGIRDGRRCSWRELESRWYEPGYAMPLVDDIALWLEEHSPYRESRPEFEHDPHRVWLEHSKTAGAV